MISLPLSQSCGYVSGSSINLRTDFLGIDLPRNQFDAASGVLFRNLGSSGSRNGGRLGVFARLRKGRKHNHNYPWPTEFNPEWVNNWKSEYMVHLSTFKPLKEKPKPVTLEFEKPLVNLEKKIAEIRKLAEASGLDLSDQIDLMEKNYQKALTTIYKHLTPYQRLSIARHPNRPTFLDHVFNITVRWLELHGDRAGYDDPAIVTGLGSIEGKTYMFIGHQKGRNTKENIQRNFGMPTPHGYRKALRLMRYADRYDIPIVTFIDTPGAFADLKCEELGQGEAIAVNLREMFGFKVPIITIVIGEGGSGGALAIGCGNYIFMLENAVFYVASPEACAAILYKSAAAAPLAAKKLRITAGELCKMKIADGIIEEPLGGAHTDPSWTSQQIKLRILEAMKELSAMDIDTLLEHRFQKFRSIGVYSQGTPVDPVKKRNMKKREAPLATADVEMDIENLEKKMQEGEGKSKASASTASNSVVKLRKQVKKEMKAAYISMGLGAELKAVNMELSKSTASGQTRSPELKERVSGLADKFIHNLSEHEQYTALKEKLKRLSEIDTLEEQIKKAELLESELGEELQEQLKGKRQFLREVQKKVAEGKKLEEDQIHEVEKVKQEINTLQEAIDAEDSYDGSIDTPAQEATGAEGSHNGSMVQEAAGAEEGTEGDNETTTVQEGATTDSSWGYGGGNPD